GENLLEYPFNVHVFSEVITAVNGSNVSGKTTLLEKIIDEGQGISISPVVKIGYFSQHITILKDQISILENVQLSSKQNETMIRTVLVRMKFWNDDVYNKVAML